MIFLGPGGWIVVRTDRGFMAYASMVKARREAMGLTQQQLAERAGCSRVTLIGLESGQSVQQRTLEAVLTALDLRLEMQEVAKEDAAGENPANFTGDARGRLTIKQLMAAARLEYATKKRVY